ncbi:alpha/beta hydrolase [Streptomyces sp. S1A]|uniref:alpha/beta fold hydrolase n=1 Tax=Streptomyces sp. ICN903 TaxID=2964654 RepID=UPI001EDB55DE|nr:alpha/beta hydrolase [Streptomyces sp. ICN903]MCG3041499.1 alpha/beta hydrolase [Streptomyces sp. ICN903]
MSDRGEHSRTLTFTTSDGSLAYRDEGTGPTVVLLHGGHLDHTMWDEQIRALSPHHRVIAPDARGHGGSSNATRPFRPADDLAALLRHLDAAPAVLVGLSMGGATAVDTALEHPGLVRALVVSGAGTSRPVFETSWSRRLLAEQRHAIASGDVEGWLDSFLLFAVGPHRDLGDLDREVVRRLRTTALRTAAKHTGDEPDLLAPVPDPWGRAAEIGVPLLAINGAIDSHDHIAMAERLVRTVPGGRAETIEGAAHYPNMENPAAYNALLSEFLRTLPDRGAGRTGPRESLR